jgi:hypothetical protein
VFGDSIAVLNSAIEVGAEIALNAWNSPDGVRTQDSGARFRILKIFAEFVSVPARVPAITYVFAAIH